ncbi:hypothetical protein, partial [Catellatospora citrea]
GLLGNVERAFYAAGDAVVGSRGLLVGGVGVYAGAVAGGAGDALVASLSAYTDEERGHVLGVGRLFYRLGDSYGVLRRDVNYSELTLQLTLAELLGQLVVYVVLSYWFPGVLAGFFASARAFLELVLHRLVARVVLSAGVAQVVGVGLQVVMDALVQRWQIDHGLRDRWDGSLTRRAAEVGSLGGALGFGFGELVGWGAGVVRSGLRPGVPPVAGAAPGLGGVVPVPVGFGAGVTGGGGFGGLVREVGVEAWTEYSVEGTYAYAKEGVWRAGWGAPVSGAMSGLAGWGGGALGSLLLSRFPQLSTVAGARAVWSGVVAAGGGLVRS